MSISSATEMDAEPASDSTPQSNAGEVTENPGENLEAEMSNAGLDSRFSVSLPLPELVEEMVAKHSAIHDFAALGFRKKVETLIKRKADSMLRDGYGRTPMHHAASLGHEDVIRYLHSVGARVDIADNIGQQPLHNAAMGSRRTLSVLVELKASPAADDKYGRTPLHIAAMDGRVEECELLISLKAETETATKCETPLRIAIRAGQHACIVRLVECKADIDSKDAAEGGTPMHLAAVSHILPCLDNLIKLRADLEKRDAFNLTPLHLAARTNGYEAVIMLVTRGAKVGGVGGARNQTALHMAVVFSALETIKTLLEHGADIEARDDQGCTPLHVAVQHSSGDALDILLDKRADPDLTTHFGETALHLAVRFKDSEGIALRLIEARCDVSFCELSWSPMHLAADLNNLEIAVILLDNGCNIDLNITQTPLHIACWRGHNQICDLFAECRASPDVLDGNGETPLVIAVRKNHAECVKALLRMGAEMTRYRDLLPIQQAIVADAFQVFIVFKELGLEPNWYEEELYHHPQELANHYNVSKPFMAYIKRSPLKYMGSNLMNQILEGSEYEEEISDEADGTSEKLD
eukprot:GEMP01022441.1.p1 GENE.GEMP01022441.1~~GEMP01022441.1.p1  ORF type:complete len:581 (+),score=145.98 GEMP01022441.1:147-1889(+)